LFRVFDCGQTMSSGAGWSGLHWHDCYDSKALHDVQGRQWRSVARFNVLLTILLWCVELWTGLVASFGSTSRYSFEPRLPNAYPHGPTCKNAPCRQGSQLARRKPSGQWLRVRDNGKRQERNISDTLATSYQSPHPHRNHREPAPTPA